MDTPNATPTRADVLREFGFASASNHYDVMESLADEIVRLRALVPGPHERYVRVAHPEMVEMLREGSQPVTVRIVDHANGEMWLEFYQHHCPTHPLRRLEELEWLSDTDRDSILAALRDGGTDA